MAKSMKRKNTQQIALQAELLGDFLSKLLTYMHLSAT